MKLHILFGETPNGGIELINALDEKTNASDEGEYLRNCMGLAKGSQTWKSVALVVVSIDDSAITARLNPPEPEAVVSTVEDES